VPLLDVPFQAGVTTILEAMAMEKTVICSRTLGQTDVHVSVPSQLQAHASLSEDGTLTAESGIKQREAAVAAHD
jgi:hypothetical protein